MNPLFSDKPLGGGWAAAHGKGNCGATGADFISIAATTLTIPAGQTTGTIPVKICGDTDLEANETFSVVLSNAVGATIAYSGAMTFVILKVVDLLVGLRVHPDEELAGLDHSQHGELAYQF